MKKYAMAISPLAIVVCGIVITARFDRQMIILLAVSFAWLVLELFIAKRQEFLNEVPRTPWIMASRALWLCGVVFFFADARWRFVPVTVPMHLKVAALVLLAAGLVIRLAAFLQLGRYFTYDIRIGEGQKLVTSGIYSIVRHPAYLAVCILGSLPGLAAGSVAGFALMTIFTVPQTLYRLNREEEILSDIFGEDFARYREKTWRLLPFVY